MHDMNEESVLGRRTAHSGIIYTCNRTPALSAHLNRRMVLRKALISGKVSPPADRSSASSPQNESSTL